MPLSDARAILVCVDYHDILALTLPHNKPQFKSMLVVTSMSDGRTEDLARFYGADVLKTDVFYAGGAAFNKFAALEHGLDYLGRDGWICIMDADIAVPQRRPQEWEPNIGCLYTPRRRILLKVPDVLPEEIKWRRNRFYRASEEFAGYFQLFHGSDPLLSGHERWHPTDISWAGGGDTIFQKRWPESKKVRPPFEVLHVGPVFQNWAGRVTPYVDGTVPEGADKAKGVFNSLMNARKGNRFTGDRFSGERIQ